MAGTGDGESFREEFEEYYVDALRELMDNYEENAYIVCNEDADKAKNVKYWTYEQYLLAFENLNKKVARLERLKKK